MDNSTTECKMSEMETIISSFKEELNRMYSNSQNILYNVRKFTEPGSLEQGEPESEKTQPQGALGEVMECLKEMNSYNNSLEDSANKLRGIVG